MGKYFRVLESEYRHNTSPAYNSFYQITWSFIDKGDFYNFPPTLKQTSEFSDFLAKNPQSSINTNTAPSTLSGYIDEHDNFISISPEEDGYMDVPGLDYEDFDQEDY